MKYYIKIFILIFIISLVLENFIQFIASQYCEAMNYYCFLLTPIIILIISGILCLFTFFYSEIRFIFRLVLLYSISTILANFICDFFPYKYLESGSVNINLGILNRLLSSLYIIGTLIPAMYFYYFKPNIKDLIFLLFYFFSGVLILFFKLHSIFISIL